MQDLCLSNSACTVAGPVNVCRLPRNPLQFFSSLHQLLKTLFHLSPFSFPIPDHYQVVAIKWKQCPWYSRLQATDVLWLSASFYKGSCGSLIFYKSQKKKKIFPDKNITQERGRKQMKLSDYLVPSSGKRRHLGQCMRPRPCPIACHFLFCHP